jgi:hypothetical protein
MIKIYQFKVKDYTTILYGRRGETSFGAMGYYVQRGDGTRFEYCDARIEWAKEICEVEE